MFCVVDPRVADWLFMQSPLPTLFLTALYILIVIIGPKWMEKREAFSLKNVLVVYNFALVILSTYMFYEVCYCTASTTFDIYSRASL